MGERKVLAIFGATGQQGGSVLNHVLADADLSAEYKIRAITRDTTTPVAKSLLEKGVEVVTADASDPASLQKALQNTHTVFAVTAPVFSADNFKDLEITQGKNIADAAVAVSASYIIFSTLPHVSLISGGKYTHVAPFDAKAEVEIYIRSLPIQSAFYNPGSFMQNFQTSLAPRKQDDGTYIIPTVGNPQTILPMLDPVSSSGNFVGAILAEPDKYEGEIFYASNGQYTFEDCARVIGEVNDKDVFYKQIDEVEVRKALPGPFADMAVEMALYYQDFGYFGPDTKKLVGWTWNNIRGPELLPSFNEWLEKNPLPSLQD
ncbi:NmrA-like family domain-containing protein [Lachnellula suecica]|uniref:NmrA-like family domain-containing protein n=1 Tax=Lachnellula suecica TaxID=602035 RepID=A0A8T9C603_9HELO|nr:NmrA-like family domain-containing protein [Lachnellula suecica]